MKPEHRTKTERLSAYRIMWLFVLFDLPTNTPAERKRYATFRKGLLESGFNMLQYSVYIRHCPSKESMTVFQRRVSAMVPKEGHVSMIEITDKQFGAMLNVFGKAEKAKPPTPQQLAFF